MTAPIINMPSSEDVEAYERNINEYEKEVFERQNMSLKKSQDQTDRMIEAFTMLKESYDICEKERVNYQKKFYFCAATSCCLLIATSIIFLASECK